MVYGIISKVSGGDHTVRRMQGLIISFLSSLNSLCRVADFEYRFVDSFIDVAYSLAYSSTLMIDISCITKD